MYVSHLVSVSYRIGGEGWICLYGWMDGGAEGKEGGGTGGVSCGDIKQRKVGDDIHCGCALRRWE